MLTYIPPLPANMKFDKLVPGAARCYAYVRPYCLNWLEAHDYDVMEVFHRVGDPEDAEWWLDLPEWPHPEALQ